MIIGEMLENGMLVDSDIRNAVNEICTCSDNSLSAFRDLCDKARNCLICTKSLSKANQVLACLKAVKASKYLTLFRKNFLVYCGFYTRAEISDRSIISYFIDDIDQPIGYEDKENAFYTRDIEGNLYLGLRSSEPALPLDLLKVVRPKKEKKASKETILMVENENLKAENARLKAEIETLQVALASKGKGKGKANADKLIEAVS